MENHAVRNGLYLGLASIIWLFAAYFLYQDILFSPSLGWIPGILLSAIFIFMACTAERNSNNGSLNFGEAFKTGFITYAIGTLISMLFMYILFNFIDSSLIDTGKEMQLEMTRSMAEKFGANEEAIAQMEEAAEESGNPYSLSATMLGYFFSLVLGAILSAIIGAITKRNTSA